MFYAAIFIILKNVLFITSNNKKDRTIADTVWEQSVRFTFNSIRMLRAKHTFAYVGGCADVRVSILAL